MQTCILLLIFQYFLFSTSALEPCHPPCQDASSKLLKIKKTSIQIANEMCEKYAEARYVRKTFPPVLKGEVATTRTVQVLDCYHIVPLIVGADVLVQPKEFPHMALIGFGKNLEAVQWKCGGSLISNQFVLSAAHCSGHDKPTWIRLGDLDISTDKDKAKPQDFKIISEFVYPGYRPQESYHDIILYKLNASVTFSPFIRPICLFTSEATPKTVPKAIVTGWGQTATDEIRSDRLLKATIPILDPKHCQRFFDISRRVFPNGFNSTISVCAADFEEGKDTCTGDNGGPLQIPLQNKTCMYTQIGITSTGGIDCGDKETPAVYTRISYYINWIQSIVWPDES